MKRGSRCRFSFWRTRASSTFSARPPAPAHDSSRRHQTDLDFTETTSADESADYGVESDALRVALARATVSKFLKLLPWAQIAQAGKTCVQQPERNVA